MRTLRLLIACAPLLMAASPDSAKYNPDPDDILWFLVVSDSHIGLTIMGNPDNTENLEWATSELVQTVQPDFMAHTGDIVDAHGGGLIPLTQFEKEWKIYHDIVETNALDPESYFDLPGNHDQYGDATLEHYLAWSVQGAADGQPNHAWVVDRKDSRYLFIGLATCGSDGAIWPVDQAGLDEVDLAFLQATLQQYPDADIITFLGHHPVAYFNQGQEELYDALADNGATAYLFGHIHDHTLSWQNGVLHASVASLGKSSAKQVLLCAYDGRGFSMKAFDVGEWPMVMVTAPLDSGLAGNHPHDYMIPNSLSSAPVRALAFHPDGIKSVEGTLDTGAPIPMEEVESGVWQGHFDASKLDLYPHSLTVTAHAGSSSASHSISFHVFDDSENEPAPEPENFPEQAGDAPDIVPQDLPLEEAPSAEPPVSDLSPEGATPPEASVPQEDAALSELIAPRGEGLAGSDASDLGFASNGAKGTLRSKSGGCSATTPAPLPFLAFLCFVLSFLPSVLKLNRRHGLRRRHACGHRDLRFANCQTPVSRRALNSFSCSRVRCSGT